MPRTPKADIEKAKASTIAPKLVVVNSSTSVGRYPQMFRIRPTLLARARGLTVGPMYLILEHALQKLCEELEAMPNGTIKSLNAFDMDPSEDDKLMEIPRRRTERGLRLDTPDEQPAPSAVRAARKSR
ncbi:hypothetical protein [Hydrogenophaga sp.]|uniref:hypothetical protein n=1 Tax=Hydrogenophaga sp. TaxID=1904254 RepID=UPI002734CA9A|nr:hypothetical protein [Hydrogenophaga sp.]MDP2987117.1 hypothetical protein [Hydrogenophaga sp.]MDP3627255.1 hypothetical protein [Hydrogenophaga sp.]